MSLKIRLTRGGAKKRPYYRIVVADARSPRDGRFIEKIGSYDPMKAKDSPERVVLDVEKAKEWLAKGAQPTDRVLRFLDQAGIAKRPDQSFDDLFAERTRLYRQYADITILGDGKNQDTVCNEILAALQTPRP